MLCRARTREAGKPNIGIVEVYWWRREQDRSEAALSSSQSQRLHWIDATGLNLDSRFVASQVETSCFIVSVSDTRTRVIDARNLHTGAVLFTVVLKTDALPTAVASNPTAAIADEAATTLATWRRLGHSFSPVHSDLEKLCHFLQRSL